MDVALKQRLVGASVLVALGVILIPMLLEGPRDNGGTASIPIPEPPERGFETRLLPVEAPAPDDAEPDASPRPRDVVAVETGAAPKPQPADTAAGPGGRPAAREGAGRWILQLGSFGNAANATRLVATLTQAGWNAYQETVEVADDTLYRVRAGAWATKEEAAAEGVRIGARFDDLDISVLTLGEEPAPAAPTLTGWLVQVGSFGERENAYQLRDRLRAGGLAAQVEAVGSSFKVRIGPELDRAGAQRLRDRLRAEFGLNGIIVNHP